MASMWVLVQIVDWFKHWAIAIVFLMVIVVFWSLLFIVMAVVLIPVTVASLFKDELHLFGVNFKFKSWRYNMFIAQDQAVNTLFGGAMDTHISGRVGIRAIDENGIALKMEKVINLLFRWLLKQENHCRTSIEHDEKYNKDWGG